MKMTRTIFATLFLCLASILGAEEPAVPSDVAAVPADAEKAASGLGWKVLQPGTGTDHPTKATSSSPAWMGKQLRLNQWNLPLP